MSYAFVQLNPVALLLDFRPRHAPFRTDVLGERLLRRTSTTHPYNYHDHRRCLPPRSRLEFSVTLNSTSTPTRNASPPASNPPSFHYHGATADTALLHASPSLHVLGAPFVPATTPSPERRLPRLLQHVAHARLHGAPARVLPLADFPDVEAVGRGKGRSGGGGRA